MEGGGDTVNNLTVQSNGTLAILLTTTSAISYSTAVCQLSLHGEFVHNPKTIQIDNFNHFIERNILVLSVITA